METPVNLSDAVFDSIRPQFLPLARYLTRDGWLPPAAGNRVEVFTSGREMFSHLEEDLRNARSYIDIEFYRFASDTIAQEVFDILRKKAAEGVVVRMILEDRAYPKGRPFYREIGKVEGIYTTYVQPWADLRGKVSHMMSLDHRKLVIIDGEVGYSGGMNVQDRYHTEWRDTHARVTGPVLEHFATLFQSGWEMYHGADIPRPAKPVPDPQGNAIVQLVGDGPDSKEDILQQGLEKALASARHYFYIQNPYFCPPESVVQALIDAAARGVDVQLMFPKIQDVIFMLWMNHSFYERLLKGGVKILERRTNFMHSKTFVCDDYLSCIGSANMDFRSYNLNFESNLYIYDEEMALRNKEIYMQDKAICNEITLEDVRWPVWESYVQRIFLLTQRLM